MKKIEALTQEDFDKWDSSKKSRYLKLHPESSFNKSKNKSSWHTGGIKAVAAVHSLIVADALGGGVDDGFGITVVDKSEPYPEGLENPGDPIDMARRDVWDRQQDVNSIYKNLQELERELAESQEKLQRMQLAARVRKVRRK